MVVDEQVPRSAWKLARVVEADADVDEHVRKALVRLAGGNVILRDRTSLVRLELDGEQHNGLAPLSHFRNFLTFHEKFYT